MANDLIAKEIHHDPVIVAPARLTAQILDVKNPGFVQIAAWYGQVKGII
jgi:hypothetical protein